MTAAERLTRRLVTLAAQGRRPRCGEAGSHGLWLSDDADDRAQAASWCTGCPVMDECAAAADEHGERFGVFRGTDRTPTIRKPLEAGAESPHQFAQRLVNRGLPGPTRRGHADAQP